MELEMTGERLVPKMMDQYGTFEHLHRYALAVNLGRGKIVLDIASGEGYGTNLLAQSAKFAYGVDISREAIEHAARKYKNENLRYLEGSASNIPLPDRSVDVVVSFETIEHHTQHDEMFQEIKRVLRTGGVLLLSSPEKRIYAQRDPGNKFHVRELTLDELEELCRRYFRRTDIYFQKNILGSLIYGRAGGPGFECFSGDFTRIEMKLEEKQFFNRDFFNLVFCTDDDILSPIPSASFFCAVEAYENEKKYLLNYRNSLDYRLGGLLLSPFRFLKRLLNIK